MKRILVALVLCATGCLTRGQGRVAVNTLATDAYVRFSNTVAQTWCTGNSPVTWGLYYGSDAAHCDKLIASPSFGFGTGGFAGFITAKSCGGSSIRTLPDVRPDEVTYFQLKAWSAGYGSWEAACASGDPCVLLSTRTVSASQAVVSTIGIPVPPLPPIIKWNPGSNPLGTPLIVEVGILEPSTIVGVDPVPEPNSISMAALALAVLASFRRCK